MSASFLAGGARVASNIFNREKWFLWLATLSVCTRCGTAYVPGAPFCSSCGFAFGPHPINPVMVVPPPPPGTTKAIIGSSPTAQVIGGIVFIIFGIFILGASASFSSSPAFPGAPTPPSFGLFAVIPILIGIVLLALGAMGISIPQSQVTYQTSSTPSYMRAGDSAYDYTPKSFLKTCPRCGQEVPIAALACYHCGAVF